MKERLFAMALALMLALSTLTPALMEAVEASEEYSAQEEHAQAERAAEEEPDTGDDEAETVISPEESFHQEPAGTQPDEPELFDEDARDGGDQLMPPSTNPADCDHLTSRRVIDREVADLRYTDLKNGTHRVTGQAVVKMVCVNCGEVLSTEDSFVEDCVYQLDLCIYCGHALNDDGEHVHNFVKGPFYAEGEYVGAVKSDTNPEMLHVARYQRLEYYKCDQCEEYGPVRVMEGQYVEAYEPHEWNGNTCAVCGYKRTCAHDGETYVESFEEAGEAAFLDATYHSQPITIYSRTCCAKCGEALSDLTQQPIVNRVAHTYDDQGICTACGYKNVCPHEGMVVTYYDAGADFVPVDERTHRSRGSAYIQSEACPVCGYKREYLPGEKPSEGAVTLSHNMVDGVCADCGYVQTCTHPADQVVYSQVPTDAASARAQGYAFVAVGEGDPDTHILRFSYRPYWECKLCGTREYLPEMPQMYHVTEAHDLVNGMCVARGCAYVCPHEHVEGRESAGTPYYVYADDEGHIKMVPRLITGTCDHCGMRFRNFQLGEQSLGYEKHAWKRGACVKCGYTCDHPDILESISSTYSEYEKLDRDRHTVVRYQDYRAVCAVCGAVLYDDAEVLDEFTEAHSFQNGKCRRCGYRLAEEAEDEGLNVWLGFVDLTATDKLNGVAAGEGLEMIETLKRVGDALQQAGYAELSVVGATALFDASELAAAKALPPRDQLIASVYFAGCREAVKAALSRDFWLITDEAQGLIDQVEARVGAMSEAERRSREVDIQAAFPLADFTIRPGVTTQVFNLDLKVTEAGATSLERYSFQRAGSEWRLINIAIKG